MLFFIIQEWEAIEPYHTVRNAALPKAFPDCFSDTYDDLMESVSCLGGQQMLNTLATYHCRQDIGQSTCQFEHYNHNGHRDVHDPA